MNVAIKAAKRTPGTAQEDRQAGLIPAVVYGPDTEPISLALNYNEFIKMYESAGSGLIDLVVDGESEPRKVLLQDTQMDPVKYCFIHADFRQINMGVEMTTDVNLQFIGESQAVKEGGTLNTNLDSVEVKCLPKDLVDVIEVDLSVLDTFDDSISVKDIKVPAGITITSNATILVVNVAAPLSEEQLAAMEETITGSVEDIEVEGKKEDEAGEEEVASEDKKSEDKKENKKE